MQLNLVLPSPERALRQTPEIRPEVIAERLEKLTASASEQAAWELVAALGLLNRADEVELDRLTLNQLYEPAVLKLIEKLLRLLPDNGTPQAGQVRQIATLAQELAVELSYAWKLAYLEIEQRRTLFGEAKARQNALAHLLRALATLANTSYRAYTTPPAATWQELHQVYRLLRQENAATGNAEQPDFASAEAAYKRVLLMALADPFRLTRLELDITAALLDRFQSLATLTSGTGIKRKKSLFRIAPKIDAPCAIDGNAASSALVLDSYALCKHLRNLILQLKSGKTFAELGLPPVPARFDGLSLLRRLYQAWRGASPRAFNRYSGSLGQAEVVVGIPAIHQLFDAEHRPETALPAEASAEPRWEIVNDSANGLAICAPGQKVAQLHLGDPVALKMDDRHGAGWVLGVIRWCKMARGQTVSAGIEKLAPAALSVTLHSLGEDPAQLGQPALLIPANPALQQEERLLIPHGLYKRGCNGELRHAGQHRQVSCDSVFERTPCFDLVGIKPA